MVDYSQQKKKILLMEKVPLIANHLIKVVTQNIRKLYHTSFFSNIFSLFF